MKVLQVITDQERRGAQVFALDLEQPLRQLVGEVRTVALAPGSHSALDVPVLGPTRMGPTTLRRLRKAARCADVVVAHGSTTLPATATAVAGMRKPFVYRQIGDSLFWAPTRVRHWRMRLLLQRASRVVALWQGAADVLVEHFGVQRNRLRVISNGVPAERFPPAGPDERTAARQALKVPETSFVVGYVGALAPEKGVDVAIRAVAEVANAHLIVAGDGPERARLEAQGRSLAVGRVTFLGPVAEPLAVYRAADVIVLTSRSDSMPAALIEAGLVGRPAVATAVQAIPEIVQDGVTGCIVPVGEPSAVADALRDLSRDNRAEVLGAAARQHCLDRFEISRVADQWAALLTEVCGDRAQP